MIERGAGFRLRDVLAETIANAGECAIALDDRGAICVIVLAPLDALAHDELTLALRIHRELERGPLVVV